MNVILRINAFTALSGMGNNAKFVNAVALRCDGDNTYASD